MDADYFKKLQAVPPFAAAATALQRVLCSALYSGKAA